jgi:hypothetical protein
VSGAVGEKKCAGRGEGGLAACGSEGRVEGRVVKGGLAACDLSWGREAAEGRDKERERED